MNGKVLVVGGSGLFGRLVVQVLVTLGYEVTILARDPQKALALRAEFIVADLTDPASITRALEGERFQYIVGIAAALDNSFNAGYQALIKFAEDTKVEQFLFLSNWPRIADSKGELLPMFAAKAEIETMLVDSSVYHTIIWAEPFLEYAINNMILVTKPYGFVGIFAATETEAKQGSHFWVPEPYLAEVIGKMVGNGRAINTEFHVGGTESITFAELIERYFRLKLNSSSLPIQIFTQCPTAMDKNVHRIIQQLTQYESPQPHDMSAFEVPLPTMDTFILAL